MTTFTKEDVDAYAKSLLIGLSEEENKMVLDEFSIIKEQIEKVAEIDRIKDIEPMSFPFDLYLDTEREDIAKPSESIKDILSNCKKTNDREIEVPKVVGE